MVRNVSEDVLHAYMLHSGRSSEVIHMVIITVRCKGFLHAYNYCIVVKEVRFYICNEPLMIMIVVYDVTVDGNGCRTKVNRIMVEDVDDIVVCDQ